MTNLELGEAEVAALEPVAVWWSEQSKKPFSLPRLLHEWNSLITALEDFSYDGIIYHYVHDLTHRDALRDLLAHPYFPATVATKVQIVLDELDKRFVAATLPIANERIKSTPPAPEIQDWWWDRTPAGMDWLIERCT